MKLPSLTHLNFFCFVVLSCFHLSSIYGQNAENPYIKSTDSLYHLLKKAEKVNEEQFRQARMLIYEMSDNAFYQDAEKYIFLFQNIVEEKGTKKEIGDFYHNLGYNYKIWGQYDKAIEAYEKTLEIRTETNDKKAMSSVLNNLGNIYYDRGQYSLAIDCYRKNVLVLQELGDDTRIALALSGIGNVLSDQKRYDEALQNYKQVLAISTKIKDTSRLASVHTNIGEIKFILKDYDNALKYFQESLRYAEAIDYDYLKGYALTGMGSVYLEKGNYQEAEKYLQRGLEIRLKLQTPIEIVLSQIELARLFKRTGKVNEAIELASNALRLSKEIPFLKGEMIASELLSLGFEKKENYKEALNFYKNFKTSNDSLFSLEERKTIDEYQTQIRIEKETYDLKIKQSQQRAFYNLLLISLGLVLLGITIWFFRSKKRQKKQTEMLIKQKEIEAERQILYSTQKERRRISQDMHDDLGTSLSGLHIYSEILTNKAPEGSKEEHLKLVEMTKEITQKVRDIVWTLNNENDSLNNLVNYCSHYAENLFDNFSIKLKVKFKTEIPSISVNGQMRKELFLCIKEALNNVLKHSEATQVDLSFAYQNEIFSITISDNGKGIDTNKKHTGNGLNNMKSRMQSIGGQFTIQSKKGTKIIIEVKIAQTGD